VREGFDCETIVPCEVLQGLLTKKESLRITRNLGPCKVRKFGQMLSLEGRDNYSFHNSNLSNLECGVKERIFTVQRDGVAQRPTHHCTAMANNETIRQDVNQDTGATYTNDA